MSRRDPRDLLILLLGAGLLAALALPYFPAALGAGSVDGGGGDDAREIIAVTGAIGSGESALYVIDVKTRHLAAYRMRGGSKLELLAAREIRYDLMLNTLNDTTSEEFSPRNLRRAYREGLRQRGGLAPEPGEEKKEEAPGGGD